MIVLCRTTGWPPLNRIIFCRWDVQKKSQFHFDVIVPFVTTQIYWTLRTFVLCRWPNVTPSLDLFCSTVVEDGQLDVPGIPAHPLFHCKWCWCYDKWCLSLLRTPSTVYDKEMYRKFHCFSVHFNSLNLTHQLMHYYIQ